MNNIERYNRLKGNLKISLPDEERIKACIATTLPPDYEISNLANTIMEFCGFEEADDWDSWIKLVFFEEDKELLFEIIQCLLPQISVLFNWEKSNFGLFGDIFYDPEETGLLIPWLSPENNKNLKFVKGYFVKIQQLTDNLILMEPIDETYCHLFDYNGNYLNIDLFECILEHEPDEQFDEYNIILLEKNQVIVEIGGLNNFYETTRYYMLEWKNNRFLYVSEVEESDYDNTLSILQAGELMEYFIIEHFNSIEHVNHSIHNSIKHLNHSIQTLQDVTIGSQIWMSKNLNVEKFRNGEIIPHASTISEWKKAAVNKQPAWCYYGYNPDNSQKFGKLYNWFAVNDPRGLAPIGWHVPTHEEWKKTYNTMKMGKTSIELQNINELNKLEGLNLNFGDDLTNAEIAELIKASYGWYGESYNGSNKSGWTALPGGARKTDGIFYDGELLGSGIQGYWWSSTECNLESANCITISDKIDLNKQVNKEMGLSVRCIKD
jgi:uncharacterized protein (TIGR02145 family)